jgi:hypothetical protein
MDLMNYFLGTAGVIITFLIALIPIIIGIALIIAIFQINGRVGELVRIQRIEAQQTIQTADLQRQSFIAQLVAHGPNHKAYLDYLVDLGYLTQDQADFVLKQSGN